MGRLHQSDPGTRCRALFLLSLLSSAAISRSAPISSSDLEISALSGSTGNPPRRRPDQEVGSPSELAWQAWLLVDVQTGAHSGVDSASLPRRITPKSVFIAPARPLPACADGYRADSMGRCVKNINIDNEAQLDFLLQRLNAMYATNDNPDKNDDLPQPAAATGPLQLNIPLGISGTLKSENEEAEDSMGDSMAVPPEGSKDEKVAVVTIYEFKNDTKGEETEGTFFRGNTTKSSVSSPLSDVVVPVAEFIEEGDQKFPDIVDYKIPVPLKSLFNGSHEAVNETGSDASGLNSTGSATPTLVLLLSPTKLPLIASTPVAEDLELPRNSTSGRIVVRTENTPDKSSAEKEIISVSVPTSGYQAIKIPAGPEASEESSSESDGPQGGDRLHNSGDNLESMTFNNTDEVSLKEDKDYEESGVAPEEEVDGEILKHGEAGAEVSVSKKVPVDFPPTPDIPEDNENPDEITSNVSSEVSIRDDVIFETTLVGLNNDNSTTRQGDAEDSDDLTKLLEQQSDPEVVFSPQNSHGTAPSTYSTKRVENIGGPGPQHPARIRDATGSSSFYSLPPYSESLRYDPHLQKGQPAPDIRTIDEQASFTRESVTLPDRQPYFRPLNGASSSDFRPSMSFKPRQEFVRFPENRPMTPRAPNYVRFPSDEANSVHAQDYKERQGYPEDGLRSSASTKSNAPVHQKQTYWWLQPGWRVDSQGQDVPAQQPQQQMGSQKQRPMLLRFWAKMPLVRDPNFYEASPAPQRTTNLPVSQHQFQPHRMDFYKEMSTQDVNRMFSQKLRTPVGG